jgi:CDP-glucose 4,6-dehydratase
LEDVVMVSATRTPDWSSRRALVTGHTGFKGGWLSHWLSLLGADVHGMAFDPITTPNLFEVTGVKSTLATDERGDVTDLEQVRRVLTAVQPEVVFHLAAQPLVRESYADPLGTLRTNVLGTANVLEAVRSCPSVRAVIVITTDKVYRNKEWQHAYREPDELGGIDPYSASKACAELVVASYVASYFTGLDGHSPAIATVRAGNVIGGGDWSIDRLLPDCLRAADANEPLSLRFPSATRPWQHVLDPLAGYLALAEQLLEFGQKALPSTWNFGPDAAGTMSVRSVVGLIEQALRQPIKVVTETDTNLPHEAGLLALDSSQARSLLGWSPKWDVQEAVRRTVDWHQAWKGGADMASFTQSQIADYTRTSLLT